MSLPNTSGNAALSFFTCLLLYCFVPSVTASSPPLVAFPATHSRLPPSFPSILHASTLSFPFLSLLPPTSSFLPSLSTLSLYSTCPFPLLRSTSLSPLLYLPLTLVSFIPLFHIPSFHLLCPPCRFATLLLFLLPFPLPPHPFYLLPSLPSHLNVTFRNSSHIPQDVSSSQDPSFRWAR